MDVDRYLQGLAERLAGELASGLEATAASATVPVQSLEIHGRLQRFDGALDALVALGELPASEQGFRTTWFRGLLEDQGIARFETRSHSASATGGVVAVRGSAARPRPEGDEGRAPTVLAVLPAMAELSPPGEPPMTLLSVELWSDGATLRWVRQVDRDDWRGRAAGPNPRHDAMQRLFSSAAWDVRDDVGGTYRVAGGGSHGRGTQMTGELRVTPAVASAADRLLVRHLGETGAGPQVTVDLGAGRS